MEESSHYQLDKILQTASAQITPQPVAQIDYALSRFMSPTMVAEYKSRLIPSEVLQQTLTAYIEQTNH